ncbi:MAG: hypothetical protein ABID79_02490 [Elusimicrobiota bacterium]
MQEKIKIVMEETNCNEEQAQIVLESCNYNVSKSISKIFDLLKNIAVIKSKFYTYDNHLYGMIIVIVDINHCRNLKTRVVVTYNPNVYETADLYQDWYEYDKKLYTTRLLPGSIQDLTLDIEKKIVEEILNEHNESFFDAVKKNNITEIADILEDILRKPLKTSAINFEILSEELNLAQFRKISDKIFQQQLEFEFKEYDFNLVDHLTIDIMPVSSGGLVLKANTLLPGDEIAVIISDTRDIAQYLSGFIGGRNALGTTAIVCKVHEIVCLKDDVTITVYLAAGVIGKATILKNTLVKVVKLVKRGGFFYRIFFKFYLIFSSYLRK